MTGSIYEILKREPDGRENGNVYFHTWLDDELRQILASGVQGLPWSSVEGYHSRMDGMIREGLTERFRRRASGDGFSLADAPELQEIFSEIAVQGELVLDIASDFWMGMIPCLLQRYPDVPVCVSDLNENAMRTLALCLREQLPAYRICTASFDNNDIPIQDNTVPYVTGIDTIRSSLPHRTEKERVCYHYYEYSTGREKEISEVYRILRPGGYFIACEQWADCDFDLPVLYEACLSRGKLFGLFSYEQLQQTVSRILRDSWRDAFTAAGFEITAERQCLYPLKGGRLIRFLNRYIRPGSPLSPEEISCAAADAPEADFGLEIYEGEVLYILRKPERG